MCINCKRNLLATEFCTRESFIQIFFLSTILDIFYYILIYMQWDFCCCYLDIFWQILFPRCGIPREHSLLFFFLFPSDLDCFRLEWPIKSFKWELHTILTKYESRPNWWSIPLVLSFAGTRKKHKNCTLSGGNLKTLGLVRVWFFTV